MWFAFGIISLICFTAYFTYKKLNASWKGELGSYKELQYKYKILTSKHKNKGFLLGVEGANGYDYTFKKEGWFDRLCKSLGLIVEHQVGNDKFDELVFIVSDNNQLHRQLSQNPAISQLVLEIFGAVDNYTFYVEQIRHNSGRIWVKFGSHSGFDLPDINRFIPILLPLLQNLSSEIQAIPQSPVKSWQEPFVYKAAAILGFSTALGITGYLQFQRVLIFNDLIIIDDEKLFSDAIVVGSALLVLLITLTIYFLGRSPRTHMVLLEVLLIGGLGGYATAYAELKDINATFDKTPPKVFEVLAVDKKTYRGRKSTSYYLYTEDWLLPGTTKKMRVPHEIYSKIEVGDSLVITQKSGAIGYRWLEAIDVLGHEKDNSRYKD